MARITRVLQKVFASAASNNGQFGSCQAGTKILSNDLTVLQTLAAWGTGWLDAVIGASKFPPLEEFQALHYITTTQLAYIFQEGIPEYEAGTTYYTNSVVKKAGTYQLYGSIINNNIGNALTDATKWQFLQDLSGGAVGARTRLTGNLDVYVATTGNDSNAGTIGAPWLTIQHAINVLANAYDLAGFTATIHVADGTYTGGAVVSQPFVGNGSVQLAGNTGTPANCIISTTSADCVQVNNSAVLTVAGFKLQTTTGGNGLNASQQGYIIAGALEFGAVASGNSQVTATFGGEVDLDANYTISGGGPSHLSTAAQGRIFVHPSITATVSGSPAFGTAFANSHALGYIIATGATYTGGTPTGVRYNSDQNSVIDTGGGGANFFPGNSSGTTATGGIYI